MYIRKKAVKRGGFGRKIESERETCPEGSNIFCQVTSDT